MRALAACSVAAAGAGWTLPALAPLVPSLCAPLGVARRLPGAAPVVALTFDDGPDVNGTPAILAALAAAGARATFFVVGEQIERAPGLIAEIAAAGHELELHGQRHRNLLRLGPRAVLDDLRRGADTLARASGRPPRRYRPPYGIFSAAGLLAVRQCGLEPVLWSAWGRDWTRRATPVGIAARVTRTLAAGDIVLLHDSDTYSAPGSWRRTAAALPRILEVVGERGLDAVQIGDRL